LATIYVVSGAVEGTLSDAVGMGDSIADRSINVLHVASTVGPDDGISLAVIGMVHSIRLYGVTARILTGNYPALPLHPALSEQPDLVSTFEMHRLFGGKLGSNVAWPRGFRELLAALARGADLVHIHGMWLYPSILGCPVLRRLRVPYVISPHGTLMAEALRRSRLKKLIALTLFERRNLDSAAAIVVTSEPELEDLRSLGVQAPTVVVPLAIAPDAPGFFSSGRSLDEYIARAARTILCVSRFHPRKRLVELVRIFAGLAPSHPKWRLRIVGPDFERGYRDKVIAARNASGADERITIEPALHGDALWRAYLDSDLFVLPSRFENFGLVVGEALASGMPVITTRGAPWPQLATDRCGWWTDTTLASLRSAIAEAIETSPTDLFAMGQRGAMVVSEKFSLDALGRQLSNLYASILT
jgi:glycosyltransferase involved in cell wall biosynthesis